jgi:23S rRNA (cytidine1920-2'-O)/16S rRNA (cytidine1409-2'-O)-methyltransferase
VTSCSTPHWTGSPARTPTTSTVGSPRGGTSSARCRRGSATSEADIDDGGTRRLDVELVRRGLARSRGEARDLLAAGRVHMPARSGPVKAATPVTADTEVVVDRDEPVWVGRAAGKLAAALDRWPAIDVAGRRCLDVGASTGGFTQVLLRAGAAQVTALDVGHDQLSAVLARDPRVEERSGTSVRDVTAADLGGPFDVVVADLSFISLTLVLDRLRDLVRDDGHVVALVKPQFEVGRTALARGSRPGVVTDPTTRAAAVTAVVEAAERSGLHPVDLADSPVVGAAGNAEYLLWARPVQSGRMEDTARPAAVAAPTEGESP